VSTQTNWRSKGISEILSRADDEEPQRLPLVAQLPQVNLLPPAIAQSIALRKIKRATILGGFVVLLVAGLIWAVQIPAINTSQAALNNAQTLNQVEQAQLAALSPIAQMFTQIKRQEELVSTTMAAQPKAALISRRLLSAAASSGAGGIQFTTLSVMYTPPTSSDKAASACPDPDPFGSHLSIGCVTFSATARSRDQVSRLLIALGKDPLFVGPYVNSSMLASAATGGSQAVSFTGTVGIAPSGLVTALSPEQKTKLMTNPVAAPGAENGA
jgi:Tfp pilus assembly protein PilN